jgi:hypothetical protein
MLGGQVVPRSRRLARYGLIASGFLAASCSSCSSNAMSSSVSVSASRRTKSSTTWRAGCRRGLVGRVGGFGCVVEELVAFAGGADGRELDIADGGDSLRGAIVDGQQPIELAPTLAAALGIQVK